MNSFIRKYHPAFPKEDIREISHAAVSGSFFAAVCRNVRRAKCQIKNKIKNVLSVLFCIICATSGFNIPEQFQRK
jgi:hypothetical protein